MFARLRTPDGWTLLVLGLITIVGATLRIYYARSRGMWLDEMHTQLVGNQPSSFAGLLRTWWTTNQVQDPPLFYVLTWLNTHGPNSYGHLRLRVLPLFFGIAAVPMMFLVVRRFAGRPLALVAALVLAVNTLAIEYSMEYRPYSMLLFTSLLFYDSLFVISRGFTWRRYGYLFIASLLLIYTHYFGGFALAAGYLVWIVILLARDRTSPLEHRIAAAVGLPVLLTVLYLPIILHMPQVMNDMSPDKNPLVMKLYQQSIKDAHYLRDQIHTFVAWRMGRIPAFSYWFVVGLAALGTVTLLLRRRLVFVALAAWTAIALPVSIYFYYLARFPWDARRNIWQLPVFALLVAEGLMLPVFLAERRGTLRAKRIGAIVSLVLTLALAGVYCRSWIAFSEHGNRAESGQAAWQTMVRFIGKMADPATDVAVFPILSGSTWASSHLSFYRLQAKLQFPVESGATLAAVERLRSRGKNVWFVMTEPHKLPKELFEKLVSDAKWNCFYGGVVAYLPSSDGEVTTGGRTFQFVVPSKRDYALAFQRNPVNADVELSGSQKTVSHRFRRGMRYAMASLSAGVNRMIVRYNTPENAGTTLALYRKQMPGEWRSGLEFEEIAPRSTLISMPLKEGVPYLLMQHNGELKYRFFLESGGDYDLVVEGKSDRPGPIGVRAFFSGVGETPRLLFDHKDNEFHEVRVPVSLNFGPNELTLYYDTFNRIKEPQKNPADEFNTFEIMRWKVERKSR